MTQKDFADHLEGQSHSAGIGGGVATEIVRLDVDARAVACLLHHESRPGIAEIEESVFRRDLFLPDVPLQ